MGIPTAAFRSGDFYIEYGFENVLFRYERKTGKFFRKFYEDWLEDEVPHNSELLCEAKCSGILTMAERYSSGGAPVADPTANNFSRMAVKYQRVRPYWLSVMLRRDYARSGDIEVAAAGRLEVIKAADSIKELLEKVMSDIDSRSWLKVTCGDQTSISVDKDSKDYDFGLRLELKKWELTVVSESSFYLGRSTL